MPEITLVFRHLSYVLCYFRYYKYNKIILIIVLLYIYHIFIIKFMLINVIIHLYRACEKNHLRFFKIFSKKLLTYHLFDCIIIYVVKRYADVAHLVERNLAKVEVASSSLVIRSNKKENGISRSFFVSIITRGSNRAIRLAE